jgi:hypothetical protein
MDTEHGAVAELLALKDAPDDVLLDQVQAIGVTAVRSILYDEAKRLRYTDRQAKMGRAGRQVVDVEVVRAIPPSLNRVRFETHRFRSRSSPDGLGRLALRVF